MSDQPELDDVTTMREQIAILRARWTNRLPALPSVARPEVQACIDELSEVDWNEADD